MEINWDEINQRLSRIQTRIEIIEMLRKLNQEDKERLPQLEHEAEVTA